jgi:hypothetical protein
VENSELGPRRLVDTAQNPIGHYRTRTPDGRPWPNALFDLQEDPEQTRNLCEARPDLAARFEAEIRRFCAEINGVLSPTAVRRGDATGLAARRPERGQPASPRPSSA